jgi:antitoxin ParD1/3/4
MTVNLPKKLETFLQEQSAAEEFAPPDEYGAKVVADERKRKAIEKVNALLLEGINSGPATPLTEADWEEIRRSARRKIEERTKGSATGRRRAS